MPMSPAVKLAPITVTESLSSVRNAANLSGRGRSNSLVKVEEVSETQEQMLDQSMYVNMNVEWVNRKGLSFIYSLFFLVSDMLRLDVQAPG